MLTVFDVQGFPSMTVETAVEVAQGRKNTARKLSQDPLWQRICSLELEVHTATEAYEKLRNDMLSEVAVAKGADSVDEVRVSLQRMEALLMEYTESS